MPKSRAASIRLLPASVANGSPSYVRSSSNVLLFTALNGMLDATWR
jgi:hypothetical protein